MRYICRMSPKEEYYVEIYDVEYDEVHSEYLDPATAEQIKEYLNDGERQRYLNEGHRSADSLGLLQEGSSDYTEH